MTALEKIASMKMITCIVYRKAGALILDALHKNGYSDAILHNARGTAIGDSGDARGHTREFEKEIITVVVDGAVADDVFSMIFDVADINRTHGGILYMASVSALPRG